MQACTLSNVFLAELLPVTVGLLVKELETLENWRALGNLLEVSVPKIEQIERTYMKKSGTDGCKLQLFEFWRTRNPRASWNDVIIAVENYGDTTLATRLKSKYIWKQPNCKYIICTCLVYTYIWYSYIKCVTIIHNHLIINYNII